MFDGRGKEKNKAFDKNFKILAVKMVTEGGHKASEVARSLGIHANVLYNWERKYSDNGEKAFPGNAVGESFMHTLKVEKINRCWFKTRKEAKREIFKYIEMYYNRKRAHSSLGYMSPFEFEKRLITTQ